MQAPPNTPQGLTVPYHQTLPTSEESMGLPTTHSQHFGISSASSDADTSSEAWMPASEAWTAVSSADSSSDESEIDIADLSEEMSGAWDARSETTMIEEASKPEVAVHAAAVVDTDIDLERGRVQGAPAAPDHEARAKKLLLKIPVLCLVVLGMILVIACVAWLIGYLVFYLSGELSG